MGTGNLPHEQDDRQHHRTGSHDGGGVTDYSGKSVSHHAATRGDQDQKERSEQFGEQSSPFLSGVVEVVDGIDCGLLVAGEGSVISSRHLIRRRHRHLLWIPSASQLCSIREADALICPKATQVPPGFGRAHGDPEITRLPDRAPLG
jgi:hypothetical protein